MRMQNTDMEFVTFDAQDVIATSTPTPDPKNLVATFSLLRQYNKDNGGFDFGDQNGGKITEKTEYDDLYLSYRYDASVSDKNYLYAAVTSKTTSSGAGRGAGTEDYVTASSIKDILDWIANFRSTQ